MIVDLSSENISFVNFTQILGYFLNITQIGVFAQKSL